MSINIRTIHRNPFVFSWNDSFCPWLCLDMFYCILQHIFSDWWKNFSIYLFSQAIISFSLPYFACQFSWLSPHLSHWFLYKGDLQSFSLSNYLLDDDWKENECAQEGDKKTKTYFLSTTEAKCHLTAFSMCFLSTFSSSSSSSSRWKDGDMTPPYCYVQTICLVIVLKFHRVKEEESRWLYHSTLINLWREWSLFKHELTWDPIQIECVHSIKWQYSPCFTHKLNFFSDLFISSK